MGLANASSAEVEGEGGDDSEDLYGVSPRTQRTLASRTTRSSVAAGAATQSESQMSVASSQPASQLIPSQTEEDSQEKTTDAGSLAPADGLPTISPARFHTFRRTMGQLMNTAVFQYDSADLEPLIEAVNARIGREERFQADEASAALVDMASRNEVM
ncbi:MAG: MCM DNA helicase complex subunit [Pleopsidium flavum]|nr:MAG: MCM DNA helicase complex subunit [Pleopsidium flavum]